VKVGDLVVQLGWEADGAGIVTRVAAESALIEPPVMVTVQWPNGEAEMYRSELKVISESR
jgi:hypothetical protein